MITALLFAVIPVTSAGAQLGTQAGGGGTDKCSTGASIFPAWYDNGLCKDGQIVPPNAFDKNDSAKSFGTWITILSLNIVSMLLVAVGYITLGFIIFGGFKYITSGDNASGTAAARKTITNAVIGLVLSIMSVAIVRFIAGAVGGS